MYIKKLCNWCGKEYTAYNKASNFCSSECREKHHNKVNKARWDKAHPPVTKVCAICGLEFQTTRGNKIYCDVCGRNPDYYKINTDMAIRKKNETEKECLYCGNVFKPHKVIAMYCSKKCSDKSRRVYRDKRVKEVVVDKDITLPRLAKKFNDTCALCGNIVNWSDFSYNENGIKICGNNYPSADHIVPLSKGGVHSWSNVQLAHKVCNSKKGNKLWQT